MSTVKHTKACVSHTGLQCDCAMVEVMTTTDAQELVRRLHVQATRSLQDLKPHDAQQGRLIELCTEAAATIARMREDMGRMREALTMARDTFLFMHEMCGYVPENIRTAVHKIDAAQCNPQTELKCTTDHAGGGQ